MKATKEHHISRGKIAPSRRTQMINRIIDAKESADKLGNGSELKKNPHPNL